MIKILEMFIPIHGLTVAPYWFMGTGKWNIFILYALFVCYHISSCIFIPAVLVEYIVSLLK
jgi:hypothetical protein